MNITRTKAIAIFLGVGFKTASNWDDERLTAKLNALADNVEEKHVKGIDDDDAQADCRAVLKALTANKTIVVVGEEADEEAAPAPKGKGKKAAAPVEEEAAAEEPAAEEEEAAPAPKGKKAAAPVEEEADEPAVKPAKKKPAAAAEVDRFGNREGSQAATINAALSTKPQTIEAIAKKAKLKAARVKSHLLYLVGRKLVKNMGDEGFKSLK